MTEYQKTYIELKKQFVATNEGPDSVRALYTFKEELEQSEDQQAKEVLVDVYDLLDLKKDAYELLCQIGNRSDKKTLKRLGTLKDYAENWGNHYALPKPKTPEEKQKEKERRAQLGLPAFRYHPNPLETGAFEESADGVACDCCGKTTHIFYTGPFYAVEDIEYLCPECISSGEAARKYDGSFQDDCSVDEAWRIRPSWTSSSTAPPATPVGSRNTGAPTAATTVPIWAMWVPENCERWVCWRMCWTIRCGMTNRRK